MVDSGADDCLFHASIGRRLGIDVDTGELKKFDGIADSIEAYMHSIEIQIQDFPEPFAVKVAFTEADGVDAILGQSGFFENYKVCFERYRWRIELASRPEPTMRSKE